MRRELIVLNEMIDAAGRANELVRDVTLHELARDRMRRDALLWNMTVLGEATNRLPRQFTDAHPQVPWPRPVGLRNRIVHGYWSIDLEIVHTAASTQLPGFVESIREIVRDMDGDHHAE